ncbi:MAG: ATP-binding protein [Candidatus Schekmanbacteria bacterium]|nr:ATP-binding protein [Candidatus Schekmanbacteria bacterium]
MNALSGWTFYGREAEVRAFADLLQRNRWFFVRVTGRRRIGKTALVRQALRVAQRERVAFLQVDDGEPAGVVATARRHLALSGVPEALLPTDLQTLAARLADLAADGWIVVLDEFQYFSKKSLFPFNSMLQFEVDRFRLGERAARGGIVLLGSLHTEMMALLEDRRAPLFGRLSGGFTLGHLDAQAILQICDQHADREPSRLLFLWGLFQGVPKYWQDAWELGILPSDRSEVLRALFFDGPAPLREEGHTWLLEELRGRYDLFLRYIAEHPGCSHADIVAHANQVKGYGDGQPGFYLRALEERFGLIERRRAAFAAPGSRQGRYGISDNFLQSWLGALADPLALVGIRPVADLVSIADERLAAVEGGVLERLAAWLYQERSRLGKGDFPLTAPVASWWDRTGAEVDLVAQDAHSRRLRIGSCKRSADKLVADLSRFNAHADRLLLRHPELAGWKIERVAIAPILSADQRQAITKAGYRAQDLHDLTSDL